MLPPLLGTLLLLGAVAGAGLAIVVGVWAGANKRPLLARRSTFFGASVAAVYGGVWILGLVLTVPSEVAPGRTICFGGFDCHLHVSVTEVRAQNGLVVKVKFASNAVRTPPSKRAKPGLDYLVPGSGNPLVQARRQLTLPAPSPSEA